MLNIFTLKATTFLVTFVRTIKHFFSPVSLDPKYSSSAGLAKKIQKGWFIQIIFIKYDIKKPHHLYKEIKYIQPFSYGCCKQLSIKKMWKRHRNFVLTFTVDSWPQMDLAKSVKLTTALEFFYLHEYDNWQKQG